MTQQNLQIGGLSEIQSWGWSSRKMAEEINRFRDRTIPGMNELCFVEPDFFGELLQENEIAWKIIYDQPGNLLGFWQLIPLTAEAYQLSEQGQICGARIVREIVPPMKPGNWYDAYFFSLSICPTVRKSMVAIRFAGSIMQSLVELARQEIFINRMSMCFASRYTMMLNKFFLQFEYCADHVASGKIHRTHFPSFLKSNVMQIAAGRNAKELVRLYNQVRPPLAAMV